MTENLPRCGGDIDPSTDAEARERFIRSGLLWELAVSDFLLLGLNDVISGRVPLDEVADRMPEGLADFIRARKGRLLEKGEVRVK